MNIHRSENLDYCSNCQRELSCCETVPCRYSWADFSDDPNDHQGIITGVRQAIMAGDAWLAIPDRNGQLAVRAAGVSDRPPNFVHRHSENDCPNRCVHLGPTCRFSVKERPFGGALFKAHQNSHLCAFPNKTLTQRHEVSRLLSWEAYQKGLARLVLELGQMPREQYPDTWIWRGYGK